MISQRVQLPNLGLNISYTIIYQPVFSVEDEHEADVNIDLANKMQLFHLNWVDKEDEIQEPLTAAALKIACEAYDSAKESLKNNTTALNLYNSFSSMDDEIINTYFMIQIEKPDPYNLNHVTI